MSWSLSSTSLWGSCHCLLFMLLLASLLLLLPGPSAKTNQTILAESSDFYFIFFPESPICLISYPGTHDYSESSVLPVPRVRSSRLFQGHCVKNHLQGICGTPVACIFLGGNGYAYKHGHTSNRGCRLRTMKGRSHRKSVPVYLLPSSICHKQTRFYSWFWK